MFINLLLRHYFFIYFIFFTLRPLFLKLLHSQTKKISHLYSRNILEAKSSLFGWIPYLNLLQRYHLQIHCKSVASFKPPNKFHFKSVAILQSYKHSVWVASNPLDHFLSRCNPFGFQKASVWRRIFDAAVSFLPLQHFPEWKPLRTPSHHLSASIWPL